MRLIAGQIVAVSAAVSCTLAIDQGTHASRATVFDADGNEIAKAVAEIKLERLDVSRIEQSAQQIMQSVATVVETVLAQTRDQDISAAGLASQRSTVLAWRHDGTALLPVLSWQDTRAASALNMLQPHAADIQRISGLPLSAHYGAGKLNWLAAHCAPTQNHRFSPLVSYLLFHLLAAQPYLVDHCNAQRTQLFDLEQRDWSTQLCTWFDVDRQTLPTCKPTCHNYGILAVAQIPLTAVSGDQNAALYGAGALAQDVALVNLGSGAFILRALDHYHASRRQLSGIAYSSANDITWLREATINGAGSALEWVAKTFAIASPRRHTVQWLEEISDPPLFINTVGGLGSPWWHTGLQPHFIDNQLTSAQRIAGVVESIVFMVHANLELMREEAPINRLRVSGGLAKLDGLCQKLADLSGLAVDRSEETEATARGIAWLAAGQPPHWRIGYAPTVFMPKPDSALETRYRAAMTRLSALIRHQEPAA